LRLKNICIKACCQMQNLIFAFEAASCERWYIYAM
jgi:hypothetical protein